ncbi:unnamed protein product [Calicophoron daubneyi]|uniref:Uncharacterized protein n=1 Tax=Calicophoron daubneyi TaxID=300641 RepID=A0AAV2TC90_CALDB
METDSQLKPNIDRFVSISSLYQANTNETNEPNQPPKAKTDVYQPARITPVYYEQKTRNPALERAKKRAARFVLEDPDLCESDDLPKEIYFGSSTADRIARRKMEEKQKFEEENFTRLQMTKQEKRMNRRLLSGESLDASSGLANIQLLLQNSDEDMDYKLPPNKKKKKQLKRLRHKKKDRHRGKRR